MSSVVSANEENRYRALVYNILFGPIETWRLRFTEKSKGATHGGVYYDPSLQKLLEEFQVFAFKYFDWISKNIPRHRDNREKRRILFKALSNLEEEWAIISRACLQRENTLFRHQLEETDKYAEELYERFTYFGMSPNNAQIMPVTYYGKLYAITRYAFTKIPILSIPMHTLGNPQFQQSGLAHELGHHFYWNAAQSVDDLQRTHNNLRKSIKKSVEDFIANNEKDAGAKNVNCSAQNENTQKNSQDEVERETYCLVEIWQNWCEEIFADICGTLLLGPQYVEATLRLVDEFGSTFEELTVDDFRHPLLYLRPLIGITMLDWILNNQTTQASSNFLSPIPPKAYETLQAWRDSLYLRLEPLVSFIENGDAADQNLNHPFYSNVPLICIRKSLPLAIEAMLYQDEKSIQLQSESACNVIDLVDYSEWLANIKPEVKEFDLSVVDQYESMKTFDTDMVESPFFNELLNKYEQENSDNPDKVFDELLELDLGIEKGLTRCVRILIDVTSGQYVGSC